MAQHQSAQPIKLLDKHDVMARLKISDTTYRRYVKDGRLKPMRLHGIDMYREDDLCRELEESRRKGRF
jgi:predicted site-specific integrase-resolvase